MICLVKYAKLIDINLRRQSNGSSETTMLNNKDNAPPLVAIVSVSVTGLCLGLGGRHKFLGLIIG